MCRCLCFTAISKRLASNKLWRFIIGCRVARSYLAFTGTGFRSVGLPFCVESNNVQWLMLATWALITFGPLFSREYRVIRVVDGDTLIAQSMRGTTAFSVRLAFIDAPENMQVWGRPAKRALERLTLGKVVTLERTAQDKYGRFLGVVRVGRQNVNAELVRRGHAHAYKAPKWIHATCESARLRKLGLWSKRVVKPWEWRARAKRT